MRTRRPFINVRFTLLAAASFLLVALIPPAWADCPELDGGTLKWIVPARPGGGYDSYSRLLQPFLEEELGLRILIQNRPEAGGIVGAIRIRDAEPDGRTLGLINASGLMVVNAVDVGAAPDPAVDFLILGRVVRNHLVMFTGRDSGIGSMAEFLETARARPIVAGVRDAGSSSFYALPVTADLLGFDYELVSGYIGSAARTLAVIRGEVDVVFGHFDSVQGQVAAGELVPLLQLTTPPSKGVGSDVEAPLLARPDGLALRYAAVTGRTPEAAGRVAADLAAIVGAGRLVVAPRSLPESLTACLERTLAAVLASTELMVAAERAKLGIDPRDGEAARLDVLRAERAVQHFEPLIRAAVERTRR
jgi:tripartite-type tricarboxylate transporter receptor subunit TctC